MLSGLRPEIETEIEETVIVSGTVSRATETETGTVIVSVKENASVSVNANENVNERENENENATENVSVIGSVSANEKFVNVSATGNESENARKHESPSVKSCESAKKRRKPRRERRTRGEPGKRMLLIKRDSVLGRPESAENLRSTRKKMIRRERNEKPGREKPKG